MKFKLRPRDQNSTEASAKGFTMVEMLIALAIFSFIIIFVTSTMSFFRRTIKRVDSRSVSILDLEKAMMRFDKELRSASEVTEPQSDAMGTKLTFVSIEGCVISYQVENDGRLIRINKADKAEHTLANNISSLSFSRFSPGLVQILITAGEGKGAVSLLSAVHVRNLP